MYRPPEIRSGAGIARELAQISGRILAVSMEIPWSLLQKQVAWQPDTLFFVPDMDLETLEKAEATIPRHDVVVGVGGGSCCDFAKYLAWKWECPMVLAPSIISVDAPLTNMIAVRVDKTVRYIGDIFPEKLLIDYDLIQAAPPVLNRAGACDIASIHTGCFDWKLAHARRNEPFFPDVHQQALDCLNRLDQNADEIYRVTPKGIDTIVDLFRQEVKFCTEIGSSRPEEGAEHLVAYHIEHLTRRHFLHGDLVGFGIFAMARLQNNETAWIRDLLRRCGLRYECPDATRTELRQALEGLAGFVQASGFFYSIVDCEPITPEFIDEIMADLPKES